MVLGIISKVCSLFLIIGAGIIAAKYKLIPENSTPVLSKLLFNVITPSVVITTMQGQAFEGQLAEDTIWSFTSFTLVTVIIGVLSFWIVRPFKVQERDRGIYRIQLAFTNVGFMGIPLATVVFGERAGLLILLMNTPFIILIYSFGVFLMLYERGDNPLSGALLRKMINIPLVFSLLGVIILISGLRLPEMINSGLEMISDVLVPLGMFIVGIQLSKTNISGILTGRNLWFCFLSLVAVPALTMGICAFLPQSSDVTVTLVYAMAMPSGTMCAMLAEEFDRSTLLASETLALTTLFSLMTLPIWAVILTHLYMG